MAGDQASGWKDGIHSFSSPHVGFHVAERACPCSMVQGISSFWYFFSWLWIAFKNNHSQRWFLYFPVEAITIFIDSKATISLKSLSGLILEFLKIVYYFMKISIEAMSKRTWSYETLPYSNTKYRVQSLITRITVTGIVNLTNGFNGYTEWEFLSCTKRAHRELIQFPCFVHNIAGALKKKDWENVIPSHLRLAFFIDGKKSSVFTFVHHGKKEISNELMHQMASQVR